MVSPCLHKVHAESWPRPWRYETSFSYPWLWAPLLRMPGHSRLSPKCDCRRICTRWQKIGRPKSSLRFLRQMWLVVQWNTGQVMEPLNPYKFVPSYDDRLPFFSPNFVNIIHNVSGASLAYLNSLDIMVCCTPSFSSWSLSPHSTTSIVFLGEVSSHWGDLFLLKDSPRLEDFRGESL